MKTIFQEFKQFAVKGSVIDLAVGIIIGGAFGTIVQSLVGDILMPMIGLLTGGINFSGLSVSAGEATITYGKFIQSSFSFLIVSFTLFVFVKAINRMRKKEEQAPPVTTVSDEAKLLGEIRDLLKKNAERT